LVIYQFIKLHELPILYLKNYVEFDKINFKNPSLIIVNVDLVFDFYDSKIFYEN